MSKKKMVTNTVQCRTCFDIITSQYGHDFKSCKCGKIFVDGGTESPRYGFKSDEGDTSQDSNKYIDHSLSIYVEVCEECDAELLVDYNTNKLYCPKCSTVSKL